VKREENIEVPWVTLTPDDLAAIAGRMERRYEERLGPSREAFDRHTETMLATKRARMAMASAREKRLSADIEAEGQDEYLENSLRDVRKDLAAIRKEIKEYETERQESREDDVRTSTEHYRPEFSIATRRSSFQDAEWASLWDRVSQRDIRSITLKDRGLRTSVELRLELSGRRATPYQNNVHISSTNETDFDAEFGAFTTLFRDRAAVIRDRFSRGLVAWLVWGLGLGLAASVIYVGISVRLFGEHLTALALLGRILLWGLIFFPPTYVSIAWPVLDRIGPRVAIEGIGRYTAARDFLWQLAIALLVAVILEIGVITWNVPS
jgi:hypothetical protein